MNTGFNDTQTAKIGSILSITLSTLNSLYPIETNIDYL